MNSMFWNRKIEVFIGGRRWVYPGIDIEFKSEFDTEPLPNTAECTLYNLSRDSINDIKKGVGIVVNAGYGDDVGTVIDGVISNVYTNKKGLNRVTEIKIVNITNDYLSKRISVSYARGITAKAIIEDVLRRIGNVKPNMLMLANNITYQRGYAAYGRAMDILRNLANDTASRLIIHNSSISFVPDRKGTELGFLLNANTGLIEVEKMDKNDISTHKIKMLLNHAIAPYSLLQVQSEILNGTVLVVCGEHDSSFTTSVEVRVL